jgi:hypothetical protein
MARRRCGSPPRRRTALTQFVAAFRRPVLSVAVATLTCMRTRDEIDAELFDAEEFTAA